MNKKKCYCNNLVHFGDLVDEYHYPNPFWKHGTNLLDVEWCIG